MKWNLMSYFYIRKNYEFSEVIRDNSQEVMIDSGAHSFQKGVQVDWEEYTKEYANFIREFDRPNIIGYFEMDVDNIIGYERVKELRALLKKGTNKIIPVWHKNRGIDDFKQMCEDYEGRIISITGFKNEDIKDEQYMMFLKHAKRHGCKVHCLGMTRRKVLDEVPFDYVDSSSWVQSVVYGTLNGTKKLPKARGEAKHKQVAQSYLEAMKMQEYYYKKWKRVCKD